MPRFRDDWSGLKEFPEYRGNYLRERQAWRERTAKLNARKKTATKRQEDAHKVYKGPKKQR